MRKKILLVAAAIATFGFTAFAQPSLSKLKNTLSTPKESASIAEFNLNSKLDFLGSLRFQPGQSPAKEQTIAWLQEKLQLRIGRDLLFSVRLENSNNGIQVQTIQQSYNGIPVEHGRIKASSKNGKVATMQLEFYSIPSNIATTPSISEAEALQKAMTYVSAEKYVWEGYNGSDPELMKPKGNLVYVQDIFKKVGQMCLAYKFSIEAEKPMSKQYVYVNAVSGDVVFSDKIIKHANANGTAETRYSGTQAFVSDRVTESNFRLRELRNGDSIVTLNYERRTRSTTNDALAKDFTDNDNNWTKAEHNNAFWDDAALDVHWGLEKVSDYWKFVHNRAGWNNANGMMKSYVHVRGTATANYDNAFWNGSAMYYGDGTYLSGNTSGFLPLTCIDVTAHELGHAICQSTAGLVYQRESGALNEGFSDIWGAAVEHYSGLGFPKQYFKVGEEITPTAGFLRDMQNPNGGGQPDTYFGTMWYPTTLGGCPAPGGGNDNCGVHYNSGVLNKWFYILVQGEASTNDIGNAYNVSGIGWLKAEQITYLTELNLTPNSDYAATRTASINAAITLFGACSNEVIQVTNAWFAVGLGGSANCTPQVEFVNARSTITEGTGMALDCGTKTLTIPVKLGTAATAPVTITFTAAGSGVNGVHYSLASPSLSFGIGESGVKELIVTIIDNATIDGNKIISLAYSLNTNGGNGSAGVNNQLHAITITDDDEAPNSILSATTGTVTLINEDFEANVGALPTGWAVGNFTGGASTINFWTVGPNGGAGINGQAAYITNNTTTKPHAYTNTSTTDRFIRTKVISTTGLKNLKLSFKYKVEGEAILTPPISLWDYGRVMYSLNGTTWIQIIDPATNAQYVFYGKGNTATNSGVINLPPAVANQATVYIGFRWTSDAVDGANPPLLIDDVVLTGQSVSTTAETANESVTANLVAGNYNSFLLSAADSQLIARVGNLTQNIGCLTASVAVAGNGQRSIITPNGTYMGTQKVVQLSPVTPNSSATYSGSLYFTADELAIWGANKTALKILKVKDGVPLNSLLNLSNSQVVVPTSVTDNSGTTGVIIYTGNFTGFSQFLLVEPAVALPVNLTDLAVRLNRNDAVLEWKTEQEINNKGFEIQRSYDGVNFSTIGFVAGSMGFIANGRYTFSDANIAANTVIYYRLRQIDVDGKATLSKIVNIKLNKAFGSLVTLQPNPASSVVTIQFQQPVSTGSIVLMDVQGRRLTSKLINNLTTRTTLPLTGIAAGMYLVQVTSGAEVETHKLIVK